jgi:hypothetical protein
MQRLLDPAQRGKGFGKEVLGYSISKVKEFGVKTLLGFIFAHNEPSLKLFGYFGFEVWAKLPNIATLDGVERSLQILGKRTLCLSFSLRLVDLPTAEKMRTGDKAQRLDISFLQFFHRKISSTCGKRHISE